MQFSGTVRSFDADEGAGYIIRDRDRHQPSRAALDRTSAQPPVLASMN